MVSLDGVGSIGYTFRRSSSSDGVNWTPDASIFTHSPTTWFRGISCPDLHYESSTLILFFRGTEKTTGLVKFGRAISTDDGVTWTADATPLLTTGAVGDWDGQAIENPSVIRLAAPHTYRSSGPQNGKIYRWIMTYAGQCGTYTGMARLYAAIGFAYSRDGITWWKGDTNPVYKRGTCGTWMDRGVFRPRLVADPSDPSGDHLHLFFDAYDQVGSQTGNRCSRTAHACSNDGGITWSLDALPALDRTDGIVTPGWDTGHHMCTSYTDEGSTLRMYFHGIDTASTISGYGYAEARWSAPALATCLPHPLQAGDDRPSAEDSGKQPTLSDASYLECTSEPGGGPIRVSWAGSAPTSQEPLSIQIFDVAGRLVRTIGNGTLERLPASWEWDGRTDEGSNAPSGRYLVQARQAGVTLATGSVTLPDSLRTPTKRAAASLLEGTRTGGATTMTLIVVAPCFESALAQSSVRLTPAHEHTAAH
ncbi:MAG: FlgD immunoglobulin-like domain containing protein [Candidatus Eisenbacteria bacterium]